MVEEPIMLDEQHDEDVFSGITEEVILEPVQEPQIEKVIEEPMIEEQSKPNKITVEEIREVKDRNFSVKVPQPKSNTIERIGSNKFTENGDNNKFIYRRP